MRVLLADSNHNILPEILERAGLQVDKLWHLSAAELIEMLPQYEGLIIRSKFKIDAALLDRCPKLKCIGRVGAGMENIDLVHAAKKNITCLCVPEGNRDAVGEHAMGMLLMLLNHLKKADLEVRQGVWLRAENRGTEICGKTVGIIGFGQMGSSFAKKLSGFDCRILAHDKYKKNFGNEFVHESSLEEIFASADILSIHLPLTPETQYYVNKNFLSKFKKPIYLINTARGKCLNTEDLVAALQNGKVLGACLDVLEYESISFEAIPEDSIPAPLHYLRKSDQVILSPHIAGWTHESNFKMSKLIAEKMVAALLPKK